MKHILLIFSLVFASVAWAQDEDIELINIENPGVQAFLNDETYNTNDDYKMSVVKKYVDKDKYGPNLNWPAGKTVSWNRSDLTDGNRVRITVSTYEDFSANVSTFYPEEKVSSYIIRNNLPGLIYYYKVEEVNNGQVVKELSSGKYKTTGQLRMIRVAGVRNVRDMGGWTSSLGGFLQYGRMYRSGYFDNVTDEGRHDFVDNLDVTAELDLRGENKNTKSPLGDNVKFINIVNDSYVGAMAGGKYRQAYVDDLRWLIARLKEGRNVNWHCHVGCDRCGTLSFLIGGLLGMSGPDLCRDYELSCFNGFNRPRSHVGFHKMIPWMEKQGAPGDDLTTCFEKYWLASGITSEEIEYLRSVMLVGYRHTTLAAPENNTDITTIVHDVEQGKEAQRPELIQNGKDSENKQVPAKVEAPKTQVKPATTQPVPDNQIYNENKVDNKATHPDQQIQSRTIYIHECPEQSMQSGKILATKVKITVNKQGKVTNATVDNSSKDKEFDLEAMRVANSLTGFTPAFRKGQPVNSQFTITIKCNTVEVKQKAEAAKAKADEEAAKKKKAEEDQKKAEEEAAAKRKAAPVIDPEAAKKKAAEETRIKAEQEAAKQAAAKRAADEEAARKKAAEEAKKRAAKKKAEEAAKKKAAEEAAKKKADEAAKKKAEEAKKKAASTSTYEVKEGDTYEKIAKRNGITVDELKRANGAKNDNLSVGKKLTIPKKGNSTTTSSNKNSSTSSNKNSSSNSKSTSTNRSSGNKSYEVKDGDTYEKIAKRNGVTVDELKRANGAKSDMLRPGKKLTIPKK